MRRILGIAWADFLERSRRFSFIAMIALALFGAYCFVPDSDLNVIVIEPAVFVQGGHPSWMTVASAWGITFFLPLMGFFYISNSLAYDEKTGVRQLAATSPSNGISYMMGKFISGVLLLYCIILAVFLGSIVMMLIRFPGQFISLYSVVSPYFIFISPVMFISALAILFDSTRFLRKSIGAIAYVLVFFFVLFNLTRDIWNGAPLFSKIIDFTGTTILSEYIGREVLTQSGSPLNVLLILAGGGKEGFTGIKTLMFHGVDWQSSDILGLLTMAMISLALVCISVPVYKAAENISHAPKYKKATPATEFEPLPMNLASYIPQKVSIKNNSLGKLFAEVKLMLSGLPVAWWIVSFGAIAITAFLPLSTAQAILPFALLWLISVYSAMGCREHLHDTLQYIAILPRGLSRQIIISWISGILISLFVIIPVLLRMLVAGEHGGMFACLSGAVFVPSLALFLGEWTGTRRAFEVVYVVLVYFAMNGIPEAAYLEVRPEYLSTTRAFVYLLIGISLGMLAIFKRVNLIRGMSKMEG